MERERSWYEEEFWNWLPMEEEESKGVQWLRRSQTYLAEAPLVRNLPYGDRAEETFDVFLPDSPGGSPVLVFIHGGYWQWMDKDTYAFSFEPFRSAGAVVANINYTLCPNNTITGIVDQVVQACAEVYRSVESYGGNPEDIHITGHSAGGHLSAMAATIEWQDVDETLPADLIKSVIPTSGIFDMNSMRLTPQINEGIRLDPQEADQTSPIKLNPSHDVPMSVVVGGLETEGFILESKQFVQAWSDKISRIEYVEVDGVDHWELIENTLRNDSPLTKLTLEHLNLQPHT